MSVNFVKKTKWINELLLPAEFYNVQVPAGLGSFDVRAPKFVDVAGMTRASGSGIAHAGAGGQLGIVNGLVTNEIKVIFDNMAKQWRCTPVGGPTSRTGPGQFQFQGGDVILEISLGVYILNISEPKPEDQISADIFAAVYSHELLHVSDEIDILNNWLPPKVPVEPIIARYLVQAQPYVYGTQAQPIDLVEREFHKYIQENIQTAVHNIWAVEANRRQALRDAPSEYKIVQDKVDTLRAKQINR